MNLHDAIDHYKLDNDLEYKEELCKCNHCNSPIHEGEDAIDYNGYLYDSEECWQEAVLRDITPDWKLNLKASDV